MEKAFSYRFYPTPEQKSLLHQPLSYLYRFSIR
ncbi:helix-turn-helix domain-containing protein [Nostoc sp.]